MSFFNRLKKNNGNAKIINHIIVNINPRKIIGFIIGHPFRVKFPIVSDAMDKGKKRLKTFKIGCALSIGQIRPGKNYKIKLLKSFICNFFTTQKFKSQLTNIFFNNNNIIWKCKKYFI